MKEVVGKPRWQVFRFTTGAIMVFVGCVALVLRHYTTDYYANIGFGLCLGLMVSVPVTLLAVFVSMLFSILIKAILGKHSINKSAAFIIITVVFLVFAVGKSCFPLSREEMANAFERLVGSPCQEANIKAYGYSRHISGDGTYVFVFEVPNESFERLLERQKYYRVDVESDSGTWRLLLCNDLVRNLTNCRLQIDQEFLCYSNGSGAARSRIFYQTKNKLAVFIGVGKRE